MILFLLFIVLQTSPICIFSRSIPDLRFFSVTKTTHGKIDNTREQTEQNSSTVVRDSDFKRISQIKSHLSHYGYLDSQNHNFNDVFDAEFESALIVYQQKLGLQVTGKLDFDTLAQIFTPRCGVTDKDPRFHLTEQYVHFPGKPRWVRPTPMTLTYVFCSGNLAKDMDLKDVKNVFTRAFSRWASVIPVSFSETDNYSLADIKIGFYNGDHGDGDPFDGVLGVLAHSFLPENGRLHLDAAETWAVDFEFEKSDIAVDLESVALHEIGHLLGLSHTGVKEAVMYPSLKPRTRKLDLKVDDIERVQSLYGSNPNFTFASSLIESDTSFNQAVDFRNKSLKWSHLLTLCLFFCVLCV